MSKPLGGVIAAIVTPVDQNFKPDTQRLIARASHLLDNGCNGLNLLGTTGEATSFSVSQRQQVMQAVADSGLPMDRFMVGTGAASLSDSIALSLSAAELGFAGALLLPPFYYKPITTDGLVRYIEKVVVATDSHMLPIYLYNFPVLSGIAYTPDIVRRLLAEFGDRIAGLKDSSGDLDYASEIASLSTSLSVFPSNEAVLIRARAGDFAGCISATANLNHEDCGRAFQNGDEAALRRAVDVREAFSGIPLVPAIKAWLAYRLSDPTFANLVPPLNSLSESETQVLKARFAAL